VADLALDTSVAVPYLLHSHVGHVEARRHIGSRRPALTGHSLAETYSVLTRLPGDARVAPVDAVTLIDANFDEPALLDDETARTIPAVLAPLGVAGGAVYDALVALAARRADLPLATRDRRAASTYAALRLQVELVPG
jgi:predicted nucleic acid-binding protein